MEQFITIVWKGITIYNAIKVSLQQIFGFKEQKCILNTWTEQKGENNDKSL